jgi:hypothetical protein
VGKGHFFQNFARNHETTKGNEEFLTTKDTKYTKGNEENFTTNLTNYTNGAAPPWVLSLVFI